MKKMVLLLMLCPGAWLLAGGQVSVEEAGLLQKLDSLRKNISPPGYFASLYYNTTSRAVRYFFHRAEEEKEFIRRFEKRFAGFFFRSAEAARDHAEIPGEWRTCFTGDGLSPLQYRLLGINAHINGDIWQALTSEFSLQEIMANKRYYFSFQRSLVQQYREFYDDSRGISSRIRWLHFTTAGLDKLYGKLMLLRWRKRQLRMAILYFADRQKFDTKIGKLRHKKEHIDRMIVQLL